MVAAYPASIMTQCVSVTLAIILQCSYGRLQCPLILPMTSSDVTTGWERSVVTSATACLSVHTDISVTIRPNFTNFSVHVAYGCTSGFVDDVVFL